MICFQHGGDGGVPRADRVRGDGGRAAGRCIDLRNVGPWRIAQILISGHGPWPRGTHGDQRVKQFSFSFSSQFFFLLNLFLSVKIPA